MSDSLPKGYDWSVTKRDKGVKPFTVTIQNTAGTHAVFGHGASCVEADEAARRLFTARGERLREKKEASPELTDDGKMESPIRGGA